jgi:hypothetical protein
MKPVLLTIDSLIGYKRKNSPMDAQPISTQNNCSCQGQYQGQGQVQVVKVKVIVEREHVYENNLI